MTINSKQKGSRSEREVAKILREHGFTDARRTAQYCGNTGDAADVIGIDGYHLEIKHQERTQIWSWIEQAQHDAKDGEVPTVIFRQNRKPWMVCISLEDFLNLLNKQAD